MLAERSARRPGISATRVSGPRYRGAQWRGHGVGGTVLRGHSRDLHRTDEKILGYPPPRNVHANTLVVAHLVTFSESQ